MKALRPKIVDLMLSLLALLAIADCAFADTFGSESNAFDIEFVTIGNPNNASDETGKPNPVGSVAETYRIGKFEISEDMIDKVNALGSMNITHDGHGANKPATSISWFEAAKFINWLNTSTDSTPAYKFESNGNPQVWQPDDTGYDPANLFRNSLATYFLPSVDEWYKAAFYDPTSGVYFDYPTGSDTPPTPVVSGTAPGTAVYLQYFATVPADVTLAGGLSPYGTVGQGGNIWEWEETDFYLVNSSIFSDRGIRGGDWRVGSSGLEASHREIHTTFAEAGLGFRVASSIPEPSTLLLGLLAAVGLLLRRPSSC